ncbi:hypothetical protein BXO407_20500 [Xanthomonas oryzae pv. oryzae]|nr:hypothetical protein BXO407_20500 [Xanthomonas oryzae pv. oryzae]
MWCVVQRFPKGVLFLLGKLKDVAAGIVGKILGTFGLTLVSFEAVLPRLKEFITTNISGLDGPAGQMLGYLGIGTAMSMVLSALTVRMAWKVFLVPKSVADTLGANQ